MTRASIERWLSERTPQRPAALATQMTRSVASCPVAALDAAPSMAEAMGVLGLATLTTVAAREPASSEVALELLAADAFVTYAFEAAADEGVPVAPLALKLLHAAA